MELHVTALGLTTIICATHILTRLEKAGKSFNFKNVDHFKRDYNVSAVPAPNRLKIFDIN